MERFKQKVSQFDAAIDNEPAGGINIIDEVDDEAQNVSIPALKPEEDVPTMIPEDQMPFPRLPSQRINTLANGIGNMSLDQSGSQASVDGTAPPRIRREKPWTTGRTSNALFPKAKTPAPADWSVERYQQDHETFYGINIWRDRFWDPTSSYWNPERFVESLTNKYYCPFPCE
jgi:hypothetical protein